MKYESEALKVIHMGAIDKFEAGVISEARMREYDEMCLVKPNDKQKSSSVIFKKDTSKKVNHFTQVASHA